MLPTDISYLPVREGAAAPTQWYQSEREGGERVRGRFDASREKMRESGTNLAQIEPIGSASKAKARSEPTGTPAEFRVRGVTRGRTQVMDREKGETQHPVTPNVRLIEETHRRIRSDLEVLEKRADLGQIGAAVDELPGLLKEHFRDEEKPGGLFDELATLRPVFDSQLKLPARGTPGDHTRPSQGLKPTVSGGGRRRATRVYWSSVTTRILRERGGFRAADPAS